uniref:Uncharacterized protein n=1 Tax=Arundo donax TaxID=35708 RepID=A0A0A9T5Y3_ARUDO
MRRNSILKKIQLKMVFASLESAPYSDKSYYTPFSYIFILLVAR